jgi:hypothetical protein
MAKAPLTSKMNSKPKEHGSSQSPSCCIPIRAGSTEGIAAVKHFYTDLFTLMKTHSRTAPGTFAILGFALLLASGVIFSFYVGFSLRITQDSAIPMIIYIAIEVGSFIIGGVVTLLSPFQVWVNGLLWPRVSADLFGSEKESENSTSSPKLKPFQIR